MLRSLKNTGLKYNENNFFIHQSNPEKTHKKKKKQKLKKLIYSSFHSEKSTK